VVPVELDSSVARDALSDLAGGQRFRYIDNLKVLLVAGVIVGHVTLAWTGVGIWVFEEPHVREPLLSVLVLIAVVGALFAMPLFFLVAGLFTPGSLERKGPRRFCVDRIVRLSVPMLFFILFLSPFVEYVDPDNVGWDAGFGAFAVEIWWPPAPGPTWFLGVLLVFSVGYALLRTVRPQRVRKVWSPHLWQMAVFVGLVAGTSYLVRLAVPLGVEVWRLALGQAPGWLAGFALGVFGAERGWLLPIHPRIGRIMRRTAWAATVFLVVFIGTAMVTDGDIGDFVGGGTWQSLVTAGVEAILIMAMSLWLLDLFRRRFDHQGHLAQEMSRSAFAAFLLHQVVLVGLVLVTHQTELPPEVEFLSVALLGIVVSFGLASMLIRLPGVSRVL
jgi:glucan biosynthesis protein C